VCDGCRSRRHGELERAGWFSAKPANFTLRIRKALAGCAETRSGLHTADLKIRTTSNQATLYASRFARVVALICRSYPFGVVV
jgi:hypothetical protein